MSVTIAPETTAGQTRYPALDGVRGLAVTLVLVWHYLTCQLVNEAGSWAPLVRRIFSSTASGVDLFFALSGFLIAGILLDQKGKSNYFQIFYLRRTCRIFPLYFLVLGLYVILANRIPLAAAADAWLFQTPMPLWSYATFCQNIFMGIHDTFGASWLGVTWSLAVEEQFYLVLPLVIALLGNRKLAVAFTALFLLLPVMRLLSPGFHNYACLPWRADSLLAGALIALLVRSEPLKAIAVRYIGWLHFATAILFAGQLFLIVRPAYAGIFGETIEALFFASLILVLRLGQCGVLLRIFQSTVLRWMGVLSYGIYMFHQPVSGLMHGFIKGQAPRIAGIPDAGITMAAAVVTLTLAWLSYRFFESPILRFAHRFHYANRESKCPSN